MNVSDSMNESGSISPTTRFVSAFSNSDCDNLCAIDVILCSALWGSLWFSLILLCDPLLAALLFAWFTFATDWPWIRLGPWERPVSKVGGFAVNSSSNKISKSESESASASAMWIQLLCSFTCDGCAAAKCDYIGINRLWSSKFEQYNNDRLTYKSCPLECFVAQAWQ